MRTLIKKLITITLVVIMVFSVCLVSAYADPGDPGTWYTAYVSGNGVNFRVGPGTAFAVKGAYCYGTSVTVKDILSNGWCLVTAFGVDGYMYGAYVTRGSYGADAQGLHMGYTILGADPGYVNTSNVNFRMGPSTKYASSGVLNKGTAIELIRYMDNGWYETRLNGYTGYIFGDYVSKGTYTETTEELKVVADHGGANGYTNTANLVVRSAPSSTATAITTIGKDVTVKIYSEYSNDWYYISFNNLYGVPYSGYVYKYYVDTTPHTTTNTPVDYIALANKADTPMRIAPDDSYALIATVPVATAFRVVAELSNGWCEVISGLGDRGYIYGPFLTKESEYDPSYHENPAKVEDIKVVSTAAYSGVVNTNGAPFSVYPADGYTIMEYIPAGAVANVTVLYNNGWCEVYINGSRGYMYASYITPDSP